MADDLREREQLAGLTDIEELREERRTDADHR
jgi:hypothetical protein